MLRSRDIGGLFRFLRSRGWSRSAIAAATGMAETRVREVATGKQRVRDYDVFERIATGLHIDRVLMGLSYEAQGAAEGGRPSPYANDSAPSSVFAGDAHVLISHWEDVLRLVTAWSNDRGVMSVMDMTRRQVNLMDEQRRFLRANSQDVLRMQARWLEFGSWAADNAGLKTDAETWAAKALSQATEAGDTRLSGYILMRHAQQAAERGRGSLAVELAMSAARFDGLAPRTLALCAVRQAHGHALAGEGKRVGSSIAEALRQIDRAPVADSDALDGHATYLYVAAYEGYFRLLLGEPGAAITALGDVLADWPGDMRQDEVMWRSWLADAYATAGGLPEAGAEALRALELAHVTGSARAQETLTRLAARFDECRHHPAEVGQFMAAHRIVTAPGRRR